MSLFVLLLVPETKGVSMEALSQHICEEHPIWSRLTASFDQLPTSKCVSGVEAALH
jgi:hypothetical protein